MEEGLSIRNQPHRNQGTVGDSEHWRVRILPLEALLGSGDCVLIVGKACDKRKLLSRCQDLQPCNIIICHIIYMIAVVTYAVNSPACSLAVVHVMA